MCVYWDADCGAWIVSTRDGYEFTLSATGEAQAVLEAQLMWEDEGVLYDE